MVPGDVPVSSPGYLFTFILEIDFYWVKVSQKKLFEFVNNITAAGNSVDLSHAIMDRLLLHSDCAFNIPAVRLRGRLCRTNQASNTAYRGFGGPQGMVVAGMWVDDVAQALGIPSSAVQLANLYREGDLTHYGQRLVHCRVRECWAEAMSMAGWDDRRAAVDAFNAGSRCAPAIVFSKLNYFCFGCFDPINTLFDSKHQ